MTTLRSEFRVEDAHGYDRRSTGRWVWSHIRRTWPGVVLFYFGYTLAWAAYAGGQSLVGDAIDLLLTQPGGAAVLAMALTIFGVMMMDSLGGMIGQSAAETVAARVEANARRELYESLLAKSKTYHDRQRVGDLMARATDDTSLVANLVAPGATLASETVLGITIPIIFMGFIHPLFLIVPIGFVISFLVSMRFYLRRLMPVIDGQRDQFGVMNAGLEETISGIEVVKASAREDLARSTFQRNARRYRDLYTQQGLIEARYLPMLFFAVALALQFALSLWLYRDGTVQLGAIVSIVGLMNTVRFPTFISVFAFSSFQAGLAGARRMLRVINAETDLDQNSAGYSAAMRGDIVFEGVSFAYPADEVQHASGVLHDLSFHIRAGQTVAIVGQTGSGKSALTQLVNRTYEATSGRVVIDGIDVRDWSLDALRSQIGKIEQDIFLFSRSIAENIAFGRPQATQEEIEAAARAAQAHDFIQRFPDGYATVVGERGMTLSGGQRQRIALARAFLANPPILILDDSTSAIDSATEDEIQRALRQAQQGRTVLMITHRLAQIRWADLILVLDGGRLSAAGSHEDLLRDSALYRRIFARF